MSYFDCAADTMSKQATQRAVQCNNNDVVESLTAGSGNKEKRRYERPRKKEENLQFHDYYMYTILNCNLCK